MTTLSIAIGVSFMLFVLFMVCLSMGEHER